jgi:hypothetical protein
VILDGSGNGVAATGPTLANETWTVGTVSVSVAPANLTDYYTDDYEADYGQAATTSEALCQIYSGFAATQGNFVDGTTWGSTGDSTTNFLTPVTPGYQVFAVWTGGNPGGLATMVVVGTRVVP